MAQARQRIADTLQAAAAQLPDTGLKEDLARLFRSQVGPAGCGVRPLRRSMIMGTGCRLMGKVVARWRPRRVRRRPCSGPSVVPTEQVLGLTTGGDGRGGRSCGGDHGQPAGAGWGGSVVRVPQRAV